MSIYYKKLFSLNNYYKILRKKFLTLSYTKSPRKEHEKREI